MGVSHPPPHTTHTHTHTHTRAPLEIRRFTTADTVSTGIAKPTPEDAPEGE